MKKTFTLLFFCALCYLANGQTIRYVKPTAAGLADGSSWGNASADLQAIINLSSQNDEIWIAAGTYKPATLIAPRDPSYTGNPASTNQDKTFLITKNIKLFGGFSGTETSISQRNWLTNETILSGNIGDVNSDYDNCYHVLSIVVPVGQTLDNSLSVDGLTIADGNSNSGNVYNSLYPQYFGGGIFIGADDINLNNTPSIKNCTFKNNLSLAGGGAVAWLAFRLGADALEMQNCNFTSNGCKYQGGAIYLFDDGVNTGPYKANINDCTFDANYVNDSFQGGTNGASGGAICAYKSGELSINRCVFKNNKTSVGFGATGNGSAVALLLGASSDIVNSVFYDNEKASVYNKGSDLNLLNTTLYHPNNELISLNAAKSIYINNSIIWTDNALQNAVTSTGSPSIIAVLNNSDLNSMNQLTFTTPPVNLITTNPYFYDVATKDFTLKPFSLAIDAGNDNLYSAALYGSSNLAGTMRFSGKIDMGAYEYIHKKTFVSLDAAGNNDGTSWVNGYNDLQIAINAASYGDSIFVKKGVYQPAVNTSFQMKEGVKIYGSFQGTENYLTQRLIALPADSSILKGNGENVFDNEFSQLLPLTEASVLDGFTLTGGAGVSKDGGAMNNHYASPTLNRICFVANYAVHAGAIQNINSSPIITNSIISGNDGGLDGGAMVNANSSAILTNVLISGNIADQGGIMYNSLSNLTLTNVTFAGNATGGDLIINSNSNFKIRNSIILGNTGNMPSLGVVASNSLIQDFTNTSDGNINSTNIDANDIFVSPVLSTNYTPVLGGNFSLLNNANVIDKGSNVFYNTGQVPDLSLVTTDIVGNNRFENMNVDLGAYEYQGTLPITLLSYAIHKRLNDALLKWKTSDEKNAKYYIIYRSADGKTFTELGKLNTKNGIENTYSYIDNLPFKGLNYYKLEQQDLDGTLNLLGIKSLNFNFSNDGLRVYPNPTLNYVNLGFEKGKYHKLTLLNQSGQILKSVIISPLQTEIQLSLLAYTPGLYYLNLEGTGINLLNKVIKR
ncbi:hypothetical protein I5M32_01920 [Pedobacter sp. SD-b]|uniref:Por secretion system C-terminal sorting domain-containing protein n=1 Tax=Pedobacter segetis TaxID=2793069 RepID=A0ABS1BFQ8_9SPHI|nr:choice-of-anchor Q domain-containing protein [Pedobacter segetis]MBK0381705.1 hypothetical protein [Pedobacter segetis]